MPISPENRERLLAETKEAAAAFVEDIVHIRETLARQDQVPRQIRHLSSVLRRLTVDNDLRSIAPPRIGPLSLTAPDNSAFYQAARKQPLSMFVSAGISVFNTEMRALVGGVEGREFVFPTEFNRSRVLPLSLDGYLNQKVLYFKSDWVTRRQVIKYVANCASGVHSSNAQDQSEKLLSSLRQYIKLTLMRAALALT